MESKLHVRSKIHMARGATHAGAKTYKVFIASIGRLARTSVINPNNLLSYPFLPRRESGRADNEFIDDYGSGTTRFACKYAYVTKLAASRLVVSEPSLFRSSYSPLTFFSSFFDLFRRPRCSHLRLRLVPQPRSWTWLESRALNAAALPIVTVTRHIKRIPARSKLITRVFRVGIVARSNRQDHRPAIARPFQRILYRAWETANNEILNRRFGKARVFFSAAQFQLRAIQAILQTNNEN